MRNLFIASLLLVVLAGCQTLAVNEETSIPLQLSGEMLFEGSNTLQMASVTTPEALAQSLSVETSQIKEVGVASARIEFPAEEAKIAESLLLQIVSNNRDLVTIGTLSPLPSGTSFDLKLAENIDLLPYFKDEGCTWVLDVNLSEDLMDDLSVAGSLRLQIRYTE